MTDPRAATVPPIMTDRTLLDPLDTWVHLCTDCISAYGAFVTQGGQAGYDAHRLVVHSEHKEN